MFLVCIFILSRTTCDDGVADLYRGTGVRYIYKENGEGYKYAPGGVVIVSGDGDAKGVAARAKKDNKQYYASYFAP